MSNNPLRGYIEQAGAELRKFRAERDRIRAICEDGERSGADRLDEIYRIVAGEG